MDKLDKSFSLDLIGDLEPVSVPAKVSGRFNLIELLAANDFGETYLLSEKDGGKLFVLKSHKQFELDSEAEILQGLEYRGLPRFEPIIECDGVVYSLREYVRGLSLQEYLDKYFYMDEDVAVRVCLELCDILIFLHSQPVPIIHRDIKPSNIIINPDDLSVTLIDFGASRKYREKSGYDTVCVATREFAAPEQFGFAQTDARSDIFSVGILLRYILTGSTIFNRNINNGLLDRIIRKCIALDPEKRFQSADSMKKALKRYKPDSGRMRKCVLAAVISLFVLVMSFSGGFIASRYTGVNYSPDSVGLVVPVVTSGDFSAVGELEAYTASVDLGDTDNENMPIAISVTDNLSLPASSDETGYQEADDVYTFIEPQIEEAVRLVLAKGPDEAITYGDLDLVTVININGLYVFDEFHKCVRYPFVGNIMSIEDLRYMSNLRELRIENQPFSDISPLNENYQLENIRLGSVNVSDLSSLSSLSNLREISIYKTLISDFSFLKEVKFLEFLLLVRCNGIDGLIDIGVHPGLRALDLGDTAIKCIEGIENFPWLEYINLNSTLVTDFSPLNNPNVNPRLNRMYISRDMVQYLHTLKRDDIEVIVL